MFDYKQNYKIKIPKMIKVKQKFPKHSIENIEEHLVNQISQKKIISKIKPGMSIAIGIGSRGINRELEITRILVDQLKKYGTKPFVIPAMGSHGGATSQGQVAILASYGITENELGVPIKSSMETVEIGNTKEGVPIYFQKDAFLADGIIPINKINVHGDFRGEIESGMLKMLVIGFGKHKGATSIHSLGIEDFHHIIPQVGSIILEKLPVIFGIACLENAFNNLAELNVILPEEIVSEEKRMLKYVKENMARIRIPEIDVLIIDEIGKNISGDGLDVNIVGRFAGKQKNDIQAPIIKKIVILDLTKETEGNACGVGNADIITRKLFNNIDFNKTYTNAITSGVLESVRIPLVSKSDQEAIELATYITNIFDASKAKIMRIQNTNKLEEILVSESIYQEIKNQDHFSKVGSLKEMIFDNNGNIV